MIAPLPLARQWVTRRSGVALAAALAAGLVAPPAQAEDAAQAGVPWKLSVTPYAWAISAARGTPASRARRPTSTSASVTCSSTSTVALMLEPRAAQGPLRPDVQLRLRQPRGQFEPFARSASRSTRPPTYWWQEPGRHLPGSGPGSSPSSDRAGPLSVAVDPYAGIRYTILDTQLKGKLDLPDLGVERQADRREQPELGRPDRRPAHDLDAGRSPQPCSPQATSAAPAGETPTTAGQASASSATGSGCSGTNNANLVAGYRALHQKYENGNGRDETQSGTSPCMAPWSA